MEGLGFDVRTPRGLIRVRSKLVGRAIVNNLLAAVTAGLALGLPFSAVERGVAAVDRVPGRFQVVSTPVDDVMAVVDYAHTDDALKGLLETVRPLAAGRLITVFGCGGERDRAKRPLMGAVAARLSELVILTSDNPRGEDPMRIIEDIKRGLTAPGSEHLVIEDRGAAIRTAVEIARASDVILVAGKGHEKTQVLKERVVPFDDVVAVREALTRRRAKLRVS
jgi:UDP-N-acetylmuramoyl-L-alanyl-D-glutamate--2,6-diaminopimelate ligase